MEGTATDQVFYNDTHELLSSYFVLHKCLSRAFAEAASSLSLVRPLIHPIALPQKLPVGSATIWMRQEKHP